MSLKDELRNALIEIEDEEWEKYKEEMKAFKKAVEEWSEEQKKSTSLLSGNYPQEPLRPAALFRRKHDDEIGDGFVTPFQQYGGSIPKYELTGIRQPTYDTEILPVAGTPAELRFFQRQLGQVSSFTGLIKTQAETNLQKPCQLANPLQMEVAGFNLILPDDLSDKDRVALFEGAEFIFMYTGNRCFLNVPLKMIPETGQIPQHVWPDDRDHLRDRAKIQTREEMLIEMETRKYNIYEYFVGKKTLTILPSESFQARICWPNGAPYQINRNIRITVVLDGLQHTPI